MIPKIKKDYISDYTATFGLEPDSTALIVVDMQYASAYRHAGLGKRLMDEGKDELVAYRFDRIENVVVPTIKRLVTFSRENHLTIFHITIGSYADDYSDTLPHLKKLFQSSNNRLGRREHEILDELKPEPGEMLINKTTIGAFNSTNLEAILRSYDIKSILFAGVSTNMCVESTARDAADKGFKCVIVEDACGATKQEYHDATLSTFQRLFGKVQSADQVIEELRLKI
jgi:nicotinamidase-related amidase